MSKRLLTYVVAAGLLVSTAAHAGVKYLGGLTVIKKADGSGTMEGNIAGVRNTSDSVQRLECHYENFSASYPGGPRQYATCYGTSDGTAAHTASCGTGDPALTDTISRLNSDSYLGVTFDAQGNCTRVEIGEESTAAPKSP